MKKEKNLKILIAGLVTVLTFVLWTILVKFVDVQAIGPKGSFVGFATVNGYVHKLTSANMFLYNVTDWLGLGHYVLLWDLHFWDLHSLLNEKTYLR